MTAIGNELLEGQSKNMSPFFDGRNYSYWKAQIIIFIQSTNYEL
jgi:hypothetical protein